MTPFLGWLLSLMVAMPVISLADYTRGGESIGDITGPDFENIYLVVFTAMGVVAVLTIAVVVAVLPKSPGIRLLGVLTILLWGTVLLVDTYADAACGIVQCVDRSPAASPTVPVSFEPRGLVTNADRALSIAPPGVLAGKGLVEARVVSFDRQSAGGASVRIGERGGFYYNPRDSDRLTDLGPGQSFEDWFRYDVTHRDGTESFSFEVTVRGVPPND